MQYYTDAYLFTLLYLNSSVIGIEWIYNRTSVLQIKIKSSLFSHTYNKQYVHFIKSDVTEEIL